MKFFLRIHILFLLVCGTATAKTPDSLIYRVKVHEVISVNVNDNFKQDFKGGLSRWKYFLYHPGDNYKWIAPAYDDSHWEFTGSSLRRITEANKDSVGLLWLRLHLKIDQELILQTIGIKMEHLGASEVYLDGKLLRNYGLVSADPGKEICENPKNEVIGFSLDDTLEHVLAIRYSNAHYKTFMKYDEETPGINIVTLDFKAEYSSLRDATIYTTILCTSLFGFFFALCFVHILIFSFNREKKFNMYHSIFVGIFGIIFLLPIVYQNSSDALFTARLKYYAEYLSPVFFISLLALLFSLFNKPLNRFFYICLIATGVLVLSRFFSEGFFDGFSPVVFITIYVGSTVIAIKAVLKRLPGAKIVGWGVISFTLGIIASIVTLMLSAMINKDSVNGTGGFISVVLVLFSLLSMPLSMSVYLAVDFARANKTLKQQITRIEELSDQSLRQEQEKKQILEDQNRILEQQVNERTAEIVTKNSILEDQKKEIMDSILYASRIQEAILPDIEEIKKNLPQSFVLFKPKDIVSGDFYYFQQNKIEENRKDIFIAAVDCTGHGVPGAFMSMLGKESLDKAIAVSTVPSEILSLLNKFVKRSLKQDNSKATRDGMDIAFCRIEFPVTAGAENIIAQFSGANRPIWIIRKETKEVQEIKATKTAIGGLTPNDQVFDQHEITLQPGDTIYLTSDGYADQFSPEDKKLMTRKFKEVLLSICDKPMQEQEKYLREFHESWKGMMEQTDDILVIGLRL